MIVSAVGIGHAHSQLWPNTEYRLKVGLARIAHPLPSQLRTAVLNGGWRMIHRLCRMRPFRIGGSSIGDTFENDVQKLIFNATAIANIADNAATSPLTNLYLALHTADPGDAGNQTTNEIGYTSYARATVARTSGGWTITANSAALTAAVNFPAGTGGSGTATHFSVGTASSGTGKILFSGTVTPNIVCGNGITPQLTTATACTLD